MIVALLNEALELSEQVIVRRYAGRLKYIANRISPEDIFQLTALKAVEHLETCRAVTLEDMRRWVEVIAKNVYRNAIDQEYAEMRTPKREQRYVGELRDCSAISKVTSDDSYRLVDIKDECEALLVEIQKLPERQAQAVTMRYFENKDFDQIADSMQVTKGCARTLVSRGQSRIISRIRGTD